MHRIIVVCLTSVLLFACTRADSAPRFVQSTDRSPAAQDGIIDGADLKKKQVPIRLVPLMAGFQRPTDFQPVPGTQDRFVVLQKGGVAWWIDTRDQRITQWINMGVLTRSEQGLLGVAFHPKFATNGRVFFNHSVSTPAGRVTRISEFSCSGCLQEIKAPKFTQVIIDVKQPWANHNAGQILFGPDGKLYIGFGDGGAADDPHQNGQNARTFLGSMLRIDVDSGKPYGIPPDNPFVGSKTHRPEIWAIGLRNPWRYTFTPDGRLITGDVGQNAWEEITEVPKGANLGWRHREGLVCFPIGTACTKGKFTPPLYVYGRDEGTSVTGGLVYTGAGIPALSRKYVFADFVSGRFWALDPAEKPKVQAMALGRFTLNPSSFGQLPNGDLVVLDFGTGVVYKLAPGI